MASEERKLKVQLTDQATSSLEAIWDWNARQYGISHADAYVLFLRTETERLSTEYGLGRDVHLRTTLKYIVIKKSDSRSSYGHIAVYRVKGEIVEIIDYFHTAQDWQNKL